MTSTGPVIQELQGRLARAEQEAADLRSRQGQMEPVLRYVMEPGVIEAVERIRQGRIAPEAAVVAPEPEMPEELADLSPVQLRALLASAATAATAPLVQKIERLELQLGQTVAATRAAQEEAVLADRLGVKVGELTDAKQRLQGMSSLDRAELLMQGYLAKLGTRPNITVTTAASPTLPGPIAVSAGPAPTTPDAASAAKTRFLSGYVTPRMRRLAELKG